MIQNNQPKLHQISSQKPVRKLPEWLKRPLPKGSGFHQTTSAIKDLNLVTVCESAQCPNLGECWSKGTATFMIMGERCTRRCSFCAVDTARPKPLEKDEPLRVATAIQRMNLKHVVITSVARDDLKDDGAGHFARVITTVRKMHPDITIEVLTPDFKAKSECLDLIYEAKPDVFNHNMETVRRLTPTVRSVSTYERSLMVLNYIGSMKNPPVIKSGFMVGLGESKEEIKQLLQDMVDFKVEMLTVGQYLRPSQNHHEVIRFYHPDEFLEIEEMAKQIGFKEVAAGPFVRSSYHAELSHQRLMNKGCNS